VAFVIAFGFKGNSLLLCSLDGTTSVTSLKVPRKHMDGIISCWNPHWCGAPQKFTGLNNVAYRLCVRQDDRFLTGGRFVYDKAVTIIQK